MSTSGSGFLDTIVGELVLLGGQRQSDATHMAVSTPPRRAHADRRHDTLFVFLDLGGGGAGGLARDMLEQFRRTYWRHGGTVTTALRQAINAANVHMLEENRLLAVSHRRCGGIVCAPTIRRRTSCMKPCAKCLARTLRKKDRSSHRTDCVLTFRTPNR